MSLNQLLSGVDDSLAIKIRIGFLLQELSQRQALFNHIEKITNCEIANDIVPLSNLVETISVDRKAVQTIKTAYKVWNQLEQKDRLLVIKLFYFLFSDHIQGYTIEKKTAVFCNVFLKYFISILSEYGD